MGEAGRRLRSWQAMPGQASPCCLLAPGPRFQAQPRPACAPSGMSPRALRSAKQLGKRKTRAPQSAMKRLWGTLAAVSRWHAVPTSSAT